MLRGESSVNALFSFGNNLVSGDAKGMIKIWDITNWTMKLSWAGHSDKIWSFVALSNGDLVSSSFDTTIKVWDPVTGIVKLVIQAEKPVWAIALPSFGQYLAVGLEETSNNLRVLN